MQSRVERIGKNEALFREVNERIRDISHSEDVEFLCECADENCTRPITMKLGEYEALRADSSHFAIVPGHDTPEVERVIEENERFAVVEKHPGSPAELAADTDVRS